MSERFIGISPILFGGWANRAAQQHDYEYERSSTSWHTRKQVDDEFLYNCLAAAERGRFRAGKRAQAYAMYGIVRVVGGIWWDGEE